jgi:hypothetical protein
MKSIHPKKKILAILALVLVFVFYYLISAPCSYYLPFLLSEDNEITPSPITNIWPSENINIACYALKMIVPWAEGKGVGVEIENYSPTDYEIDSSGNLKTNLYIDNKPVSNITKVSKSYVIAPSNTTTDSFNKKDVYNIHWFPFLTLGEHTAKVTVVTSQGEEVKFEWKFKLIFR